MKTKNISEKAKTYSDNTSTKRVLIINQSAIAKQLHISQSYVSLILLGKRRSEKYGKKIKNLIQKAAEELKTKAA